ncbi:glycosyltransferase [Inquilinus sp. KBS0705]|nr:glycosyltransferase [Inquilinus sp. KBS0705]
MKKHIILTELFETGGSNSHLKVLIQYFKSGSVILALADKDQLPYLQNIHSGDNLNLKILPGLHQFACLTYRLSTNIREGMLIAYSITRLLFLSIKNGFADITISAVAPEKHLYLFWIPFIKVTYILHTLPSGTISPFTTYTCNVRLGKQKKIIAVSDAMNKLLCKEWAIDTDKQAYVVTIHNTLLHQDVGDDNVLTDANKKTVLTIGRVDENKNPAMWLQVAQAITATNNDVDFIWLGNGPEFEHYRNLTVNEPNITFKGLIKNPEAYLKKAAVYYQPSFNESHGIAVLEAMRNSLPCIVANVGGLVESVTDNVNGLLADPLNFEQNINAVRNLLSDTEKSKTYGDNSLKKYNELFAYPIFKAKMDNIYCT